MENIIEDDYVKKVCRPGSEDTCRYLLLGPCGWTCGKEFGIKDMLDERVSQKTIRAKGDNCAGIKTITGAA